jgi:oligoendopeptidase F
MEYLSMRHIDEFFDLEDTVKFRRGRWKKAVTLLCYVAVVDEFQHWVYAHPEATPDERDQAWDRIWDQYEKGVDFSGVEHYKALRWYAQLHIFMSPFYYIDYAIAETGAMQLALIDAEDHTKAMETYLDLCRIGGTKSVLDIFNTAGLRSPFDPEVMRDLMGHAAKEMGIQVEVGESVG